MIKHNAPTPVLNIATADVYLDAAIAISWFGSAVSFGMVFYAYLPQNRAFQTGAYIITMI